MSDTHEKADWKVRVYNGTQIIKSWVIQNRTEHEADRDAAAAVRIISEEHDNWTVSKMRT